MSTSRPYAVVAIPAHNEADRIEGCLAALLTQRDRYGAPLPADSVEIVVFANNCTDQTVAIARSMMQEGVPLIVVVEETLPRARASAGWARRRAMDLAAARLAETGGVILTTDADSLVAPTWINATLQAFAKGADAVAGYVDAQPTEIIGLGQDFVRRGRLEDTYHRLVTEVQALCDPRPHDPWPNHRMSAGASLAVSLASYRAIGGLPVRTVGEDVALTQALERAGFKVRHALDVVVSTSCRFEGRAKGGAAETMRERHANPDAPCDDDLEPALHTVRRALAKGRLRRLAEADGVTDFRLSGCFSLSPADASGAIEIWQSGGFEDLWSFVSRCSPRLIRVGALRPSDLPREIRRAASCIRALRAARSGRAQGFHPIHLGLPASNIVDPLDHLVVGGPARRDLGVGGLRSAEDEHG